jgi:hypothetical protein
MTKTITVGIAMVFMVMGTALAHHGPSVLGTVRITQPVLAGGKLLQPGTYEIRLTGEHLTPLPGQSENAEQRVAILANGIVVAHDVATVLEDQAVAVGTSGGSGTRPRVDLLRGGEFVRVSVYRDGTRYLVHLPPAR